MRHGNWRWMPASPVVCMSAAVGSVFDDCPVRRHVEQPAHFGRLVLSEAATLLAFHVATSLVGDVVHPVG